MALISGTREHTRELLCSNKSVVILFQYTLIWLKSIMGVMVYVQSLLGGSVKSLFCLQESTNPGISIGIFLCQGVNMTQASLPKEVLMAFWSLFSLRNRPINITWVGNWWQGKKGFTKPLCKVTLENHWHLSCAFQQLWERRGHNRQLKSKHFNPRDDFLKTGV